MAPHALAYHREESEHSRTFKQFDKYMLRRKGYRKERKLRLYHSRAQGTIRAYTAVVKDYVTYMHEEENANPFPVTESSLRRYIDSLDLYEDRSKFVNIKPAMMFVRKARSDPEFSFNSTDLILEGLLREVGARCKKEYKPDRTNELNVRKFILRGLYGPSFKAPYNENMVEFRTALRALSSLFCLSRCADFMELRRENIKFEDGNVLIIWGKRKNDQRSNTRVSLVPELPLHPMCVYRAFQHFIDKTELKEDQFINCKLTRRGKALGDRGIARSTCYANIKTLCESIKIDQITEKMCKSLGTR